MTSIVLLALICLALSYNGCAQRTLLIHPPNDLCKQENCYTLDSYAVHSKTNLTESNTTLMFLRGVHPLSYNLTFQNIDNLSLVGYRPTSVISCTLGNTTGSTIAFVNITNLTINGLNITNCGAEIGQQLSAEVMVHQTRTVHIFDERLKVAIFAVNIRSLYILRTIIERSNGYGLLAVNALGHSIVYNSTFIENNYRTNTAKCWNATLSIDTAIECQGGNALFLFADTHECIPPVNFTLRIISSTFAKGLDLATGQYSYTYIGSSGGLGVILSQLDYGVKVNILNVFSANNTAKRGANIYFRIFNTVINSSFHLKNCKSWAGNTFYLPLNRTLKSLSNTFGNFAGLYYVNGIIDNSQIVTAKCRSTIEQLQGNQTDRGLKIHDQVLTIEDSQFHLNFAIGGSGIFLQFYTSFNRGGVERIRSVLIKGTNMTDNRANGASALWLYDFSSTSVNEPIRVTLENLRIERNQKLISLSFTLVDRSGYVVDTTTEVQLRSTVLFLNMKNVVIKDCVFEDNINSALSLIDSTVTIEGMNVFHNNFGQNGAGMFFTRASIAFLRPNTSIIFQNNYATSRGGAVYVASSDLLEFDIACSFQVLDPSLLLLSEINIDVKFINNSATESGDAFYGGQLDRCTSTAPSGFIYHNASLKGKEFDFISDLTNQPTTNSIISSDAVDVCLCFNGQHNCSVNKIVIEIYPGEEFSVSVVGVGQRGGLVPIITRAFPTWTNQQFFQKTKRICSENVFRVQSARPQEAVFISTEGYFPGSGFLGPPIVFINLTRPCPTGFSFNNESRICDCDIRLADRNMTCDIDSRIITRSPPYWISNTSNYLLLHDHCPFDYCKTTSVQITLLEPNISKQCAFNRYGRLCGQCEDGFSAVFGTSRCLPCSNTYLLLILPLGIAGILLVIFLFLLNMTVSIGTINGLIFYANIFKINEAIFLSPGDNSFFKLFISWVNLDLGIETCFYHGMDSYVKTWLQFVFPFYLWILLFAIIIGSRYSSLLVKVCGRHSVSVLATIFLLSYTKLLRVVITTLSYTTLNYPDGDRGVWLYDGHLDFGKGRHIGLVLFAILILVVVAIPYTFLILIVQLLRRYSHKKGLKWVTKFMPIFDAYLGPYKDKHGYWTGLLLLIRVVLVVVFAFNVAGDPAVNIMAITLTAVLIITLSLSFGGVYKEPYLTALELLFVINLGGLSVVTGYVLQTRGHQNIVGYISISVSLLAFIFIVLFHIFKRGSKLFKKVKRRRKARKIEVKETVNVAREESPEAFEVDYNAVGVTTTLIQVNQESETNSL